MIDWQPIETAPKDGRAIIGWIGVPWLFSWVERQETRKKITGRRFWIWKRYTEEEYKWSGWHGLCPHGVGYCLMWPRFALYNQPSHWMPLLDPPKD